MNSRLSRLILLVALTLAITACGTPLRTVNTLAEVGNTDMLIVGSIEFNPPIAQEQELGTFNKHQEGRTYIVISEKLEFVDKYTLGNMPTYIDTHEGKLFMVKVPRKTIYLLELLVWMEAKGETAEQLRVQAGFKVQPKGKAKAIYIGKIRLYRDEFMDITKVKVINDYKHARAEFRKKYGKKASLTKSLVSIPKAK